MNYLTNISSGLGTLDAFQQKNEIRIFIEILNTVDFYDSYFYYCLEQGIFAL